MGRGIFVIIVLNKHSFSVIDWRCSIEVSCFGEKSWNKTKISNDEKTEAKSWYIVIYWMWISEWTTANIIGDKEDIHIKNLKDIIYRIDNRFSYHSFDFCFKKVFISSDSIKFAMNFTESQELKYTEIKLEWIIHTKIVVKIFHV